MDMCRACMVTEIDLMPLNESFIYSYNLLTNLNINLNDNMPQQYCQICADNVKNYIQFRNKSISIEETLRNMIKDVKLEMSDLLSIQNECQIKIEKTDFFEESIGYNETNEYCIDDNHDDKPLELKYEESIRRSSRQCEKQLNIVKRKNELNDVKVKKIHSKKTKETLLKLNEEVKAEDKVRHCGICPNKFEDLNELQSHLETHKTNKACGTCNAYATSWPQLFGHRIKHLPVNQKKCYLCNKRRYSTSLQMEYHYLVSHYEGQDKHITCKLCCRKYSTPRKLKKHLYTVHSETKFFCDYCSKGFRCKSALKSHIKIHLDYNTHSCNLCEYACRSYGSLQRHRLQSHCPTKTTCKECSRIFENQEKMDSHNCIDKVVVCPFCGLQLTGVKKISQHIKMHQRKGKSYNCSLCPAKYKSRGALKAHVDRHNGVKTHVCEYCDSKFYTASTLIKHRRIHTGEKPYVCNICNKGFTGNHNLKMHMRVHGQFLIMKKNVTVI